MSEAASCRLLTGYTCQETCIEVEFRRVTLLMLLSFSPLPLPPSLPLIVLLKIFASPYYVLGSIPETGGTAGSRPDSVSPSMSSRRKVTKARTLSPRDQVISQCPAQALAHSRSSVKQSGVLSSHQLYIFGDTRSTSQRYCKTLDNSVFPSNTGISRSGH